MKQVLISQGKAILENVPAPMVEPGKILVQVAYSCISIGTEMSGIKASGMPLWKRALAQPEKVKRVLKMVAENGFDHTRNLIKERLALVTPTGYSAAGIVIGVGEGIDDVRVGDRVACGGAQCAYHAEVINVSRNLAVPVPKGLDIEEACTVTLGAIALQGVRRAHPTLGETFVVIGLGILGQLTAQILRCNGCRVIAVDLDRTRIAQARELGADACIHPNDDIDVDQVMRITDGIGADGVIIAAATPSDEVISTAFRMCRKKGRVVLVGDVGLHLNRNDFYYKELDFFISTSYGPGRYDSNYEEKGLDYPVGYVRWTENRNMAEYLKLVASGLIKVKPLLAAVYPIDDAERAYKRLKDGDDKPLMVLLSYPDQGRISETVRTISHVIARPSPADKVRIAVIGAGSFSKGVHLPNIKALSHLYHLKAIMSRTGYNATIVAKQFGAEYATTDYNHILSDPDIDAVLITTRHNLHAAMVLEALKAGKYVFVEKPLAITRQELADIEAFYASARSTDSVPLLLTGFNRRFSRCARKLYELVQSRSNPMILNYRMNAGYIPMEHWVHTEEGGGRNIGEACHIYDLFTYFTSSRVKLINAQSITPATHYYSNRDNFVATMNFEDGSVATLTYTSLGHGDYPKEKAEIFVDGKVLKLDDYKRLVIFGTTAKGIEGKKADKGHREELEMFALAIKEGGEWPIPLWQQVQATEIALRVEDYLRNGRSNQEER